MAKFVAHNRFLEDAAVSTGAARFVAAGHVGTARSAADAARQFKVHTITDQSSLSAKCYVQDGLIAMWDGIENAGWGVHNPNANVWKPLIGDIEFNVEGCSWHNDGSLYIPEGIIVPTVHRSVFPNYEVVGKPFTIQFIFKVDLYVREKTYLTIDEFYVYWQNEQEILCPFNHGGSPNKHWNTFSFSMDEKLDYGLNTFTSTGESSKMTFFRNTEPRDWKGDRASDTVSPRPRVSLNPGGLGSNYQTIRVYNRVLTTEEIAANYAIDKLRFFIK